MYSILTTLVSFGQYNLPPTKTHFNKLVSIYGADTLSLANHEIIKLKYSKKYSMCYEGDINAQFEFIVYLVDNKYILKSYRDLNREQNILFDTTFTDIFVFPDSSLGISTYSFDSPYTHHICGGCTEEHQKIYRITQNKFQCILDLKLQHQNTGYIFLNDSTLFPYSDQSTIFKKIKYRKDGVDVKKPSEELQGEFPSILLSWTNKQQKLKMNIVTGNFDNNDKKHTSEYTSLTISFNKVKDSYIWTWH